MTLALPEMKRQYRNASMLLGHTCMHVVTSMSLTSEELDEVGNSFARANVLDSLTGSAAQSGLAKGGFMAFMPLHNLDMAKAVGCELFSSVFTPYAFRMFNPRLISGEKELVEAFDTYLRMLSEKNSKHIKEVEAEPYSKLAQRLLSVSRLSDFCNAAGCAWGLAVSGDARKNMAGHLFAEHLKYVFDDEISAEVHKRSEPLAKWYREVTIRFLADNASEIRTLGENYKAQLTEAERKTNQALLESAGKDEKIGNFLRELEEVRQELTRYKAMDMGVLSEQNAGLVADNVRLQKASEAVCRDADAARKETADAIEMAGSYEAQLGDLKARLYQMEQGLHTREQGNGNGDFQRAYRLVEDIGGLGIDCEILDAITHAASSFARGISEEGLRPIVSKRLKHQLDPRAYAGTLRALLQSGYLTETGGKIALNKKTDGLPAPLKEYVAAKLK